MDVVLTADNSDWESRIRAFANGFHLKRNTTWDRFNASPSP